MPCPRRYSSRFRVTIGPFAGQRGEAIGREELGLSLASCTAAGARELRPP